MLSSPNVAKDKLPVSRGAKGKQIRFVQEWLCLHGFAVVIDGEFGPATEQCVKEFQRKASLNATGIVDSTTFERLTLPLANALRPIEPNGRSLGEMMIAYAEQHLAQRPREVGGENRGPWVRLYTGGREGPAWPWCAAFVSFILRLASKTLPDLSGLPIPASLSCDLLAAGAKRRGRFLANPPAGKRSQVTPGSIFLVRRTKSDWIHTGIVVRVEAEFFTTIEGNTNDSGSREGYEVCKRTRGYRNKDFILI
jgi:hypothetical protein